MGNQTCLKTSDIMRADFTLIGGAMDPDSNCKNCGQKYKHHGEKGASNADRLLPGHHFSLLNCPDFLAVSETAPPQESDVE